MESQPQNPEFRNNPETFTHAIITLSLIKLISTTMGPIFTLGLSWLLYIFTTFRSKKKF